jgi:hypothetical protein
MPASLRILEDKDRMPLEEGASLLGVSLWTMRRYCQGDLEYIRTAPGRGGRFLTSRQAIERYVAKLNGIDPDDTEALDPTLAAAGS